MPETQYINQTTTQQIPPWMQSAIQDLLNRGTSIANEPYQTYSGPRIAGFTPDQIAGQDFLRQHHTAYAPWLGAAGNFGFMAAGNDVRNAGSGMFGKAEDLYRSGAGLRSTDISAPLLGQGVDYLRQSASERAIDVANPYIAGSTAPTGLASATPYIQSAASPMGLTAASPYLSAAGRTFPQAADEYMNPYTRNVTDEIARMGARNLQENLLPQISDQFVRAGQFGSPQQRDVVGRALRDTQEAILSQQGQALERGYGMAGQLFGQDASRMAGLAGTAGGLGTAQQQALLSAGSTLGGLGQQQQQIMQQAGLGLGGLASGDLGRVAQAGMGIGNLGIQQAQLAGADASRQLTAASGLAGIGQSQIGAAQADAAKNLQGGQLMGQLANLQNNFVLQNAAALGASGQEQQAQRQRGLDLAYQDFLNQQQQPWQNIGYLSNIIHGLPMSQSTTTSGSTTSPSPSMLSQVGGLGLGAVGLANSGIFRAKGGAVRKYPRYKKTHSYGNTPRRGISFQEAA